MDTSVVYYRPIGVGEAGEASASQLFSHQIIKCHMQVVLCPHSPDEVCEQQVFPVVWDMGHSIHKGTDDLYYHGDCIGGCGLRSMFGGGFLHGFGWNNRARLYGRDTVFLLKIRNSNYSTVIK